MSSPLILIKTKKFINKFFHNLNLQVKSYLSAKKNDFFLTLVYLAEVSFTGIVTYYALTHFNWISVAIAIALITYYFEWSVQIVKKKYE